MLDILIKNGKIIDGSGKPWFFGDIGIKSKCIVDIGNLDVDAEVVINANKKCVCPGFIDVHSHSDLMVLKKAGRDIKIRQGVTSEVVGNCGFSPAPTLDVNISGLINFIEPIIGNNREKTVWKTTGEYINELKSSDLPNNIGVLMGNGALRIGVKGFEKSVVTADEFKQIEYFIEEGLDAGALGLSLGLMYAPENFYKTDELISICKILNKYSAILTSHIRGEGNSLIPSIKEVLTIAEKTDIPLEISHIKAAGKSNWGNVDVVMDMIERARDRGVQVTCDIYPYTAGSSTLASLFPPGILEGGFHKAAERLKDSNIRSLVLKELSEEQDTWDNLVCSTGWDSVYISSVFKDDNKFYIGHSILELAQNYGIDPAQFALNLYIKDEGQTGIIFFHMSDSDVEKLIKWEYTMIASDSIYKTKGKPHPRLYGTFPRVFSHYVREKKILSLEEAVRKATSFPAEKFKLNKRGLIKIGYTADIAIFDPDSIYDMATYDEPEQYPAGIEYVLLGGKIVYRYDKALPTDSRWGEVLVRNY